MGQSRESIADDYGLKLAQECHERLKGLPDDVKGVRTMKAGQQFTVFGGANREHGLWFFAIPKNGETMRDWQRYLDELGEHVEL